MVVDMIDLFHQESDLGENPINQLDQFEISIVRPIRYHFELILDLDSAPAGLLRRSEQLHQRFKISFGCSDKRGTTHIHHAVEIAAKLGIGFCSDRFDRSYFGVDYLYLGHGFSDCCHAF